MPYWFCRKYASVGWGLTGTDAISKDSPFLSVLIHSYQKVCHAFSKTEGVGERSLFPFTGYQSYEERAHTGTLILIGYKSSEQPRQIAIFC